jgi:hypothetical protein
LVIGVLAVALAWGGSSGCGEDECADVTCSGHGACVVDDDRGEAQCDCETGYVAVGLECESVCADVSCGGVGTCEVTAAGEPWCDCDPGYESDGLECVDLDGFLDGADEATCDDTVDECNQTLSGVCTLDDTSYAEGDLSEELRIFVPAEKDDLVTVSLLFLTRPTEGSVTIDHCQAEGAIVASDSENIPLADYQAPGGPRVIEGSLTAVLEGGMLVRIRSDNGAEATYVVRAEASPAE